MPLKFNIDAPDFVPGFAFAETTVSPTKVVESSGDIPIEKQVQEPSPPPSGAMEAHNSVPKRLHQQQHSSSSCGGMSKEKRPTLPRINSGEALDTLEFDFEDAMLSSPLADLGSPRHDGNSSVLLWEQKSAGQDVEEAATEHSELTADGVALPSPSTASTASEEPGRSPSSVGKVDADSFEILYMIGQGGFGKVFQVRRKETGRIYAMKCMRKDCVLKENLRGTKAERSILSSLRHPYIVNMHFAFQCRSRLYIVMDYFPGGQFLDMLQYHSPFDENACRIYSGEIVLALEELHRRGIVHRDLKPENLLVDSQGHLSVTDFGCSKMHSAEGEQIRTMSWAGTELYMAPEQLDKKEYGSEVDWWALGALAWEMATGDHPFYSNSRKAITNNILKKKLTLPSWLPASTHSFLKGLLTRDPTKRLGHKGGSTEVKAHPFFKMLNFDKLLAKDIAAPLRSHAKVCDDADVSGHSERYTKAPAALSPVASPHLISSSQQHHFEGFSWAEDHSHMCCANPLLNTEDTSAEEEEEDSINNNEDDAASESDCSEVMEQERLRVSTTMAVGVPIPQPRRTISMPTLALSPPSPLLRLSRVAAAH